ncbi:MAG: ATP synthase subunit I [Pseudomonadota bacterium]
MTQTRPNQAPTVADTAATRATPEFNSSVVPLTLLAQTGLSLFLGLVFWFVFGKTVALSVVMGGATAVIPNAFLAARMLRPGSSAESMMRMAWVGEIGKLLLTGLMFGAIFALVRPVSPVAVIGGYIAAQLVILGALYVDGRAGYKTSNKSE